MLLLVLEFSINIPLFFLDIGSWSNLGVFSPTISTKPFALVNDATALLRYNNLGSNCVLDPVKLKFNTGSKSG